MIQKIYRYLSVYSPTKIIWYVFLEARMFMWGLFKNSYSQNKEDIVIANLLGEKRKGFYVDIGAYDPSRFSNTKRFYLRDWRGINVEPDSVKIEKFYAERPEDINLNIGIAGRNGSLNFHRFEPNTLSTFSKDMAKEYQRQGYKLAETSKIHVFKLGDVLTKHHNSSDIDFFSIDTEGLDLEVLKSNDWKNFRPKVICIEGGKSTDKFLESLGYQKVYKTPTNSIFQDSSLS